MAHAVEFHGVEFKKDAAADGPPYGQETQMSITRLCVQGFMVMQLLPFSFFEGKEAQSVFQSLLPRWKLPTHQVVMREVNALASKQDLELQKVVAKLRGPLGKPLCVCEIDCWPAPNGENFFGLFLHGLTATFQPYSLLVHADELGVPETAQNIGQRMIYVVAQRLGADINELANTIHEAGLPQNILTR